MNPGDQWHYAAMFFKRNIIYCIGDSHISFFSGKDKIQPLWPKPCLYALPYFESYRLGPSLAYNLCRNNTVSMGRERLYEVICKQIPKGSHVLFCFGEIDCRAHILKQAEKQKIRLENVIKECVVRYFSVIKEIKNMGYYPVVWNVIPPTSRMDLRPETHEYPTYGSQNRRNEVTVLFNRYLDKLCNESNIPMISIYDKLVDNKGNAKSDFYIDDIHLSQKAMPLVLEVVERYFPEIRILKFTNNRFVRIISFVKQRMLYDLVKYYNTIKKCI